MIWSLSDRTRTHTELRSWGRQSTSEKETGYEKENVHVPLLKINWYCNNTKTIDTDPDPDSNTAPHSHQSRFSFCKSEERESCQKLTVVSLVQPRLHPLSRSHPQIWPEHLPSVLPREEPGYWFHQGTEWAHLFHLLGPRGNVDMVFSLLV